MANSPIDRVRRRLLAGDHVRMGFAGGCRVWWFEGSCHGPYAEVDDATMREAAFGGNGQPLLEEQRDSLWGWDGNSQTWTSVYAEG